MNGKRYIALSLLLLISFKTLLVPFVYLDFQLRKEYIVQHLCENRFKPELHCDGQCYLAKSLTKIAEEKATNEAERQGQAIKKVMEEIFDNTLFFAFELTAAFRTIAPLNFLTSAAPIGYAVSLWHPPTV